MAGIGGLGGQPSGRFRWASPKRTRRGCFKMEQWRRWGPRQDGFRVCASARATRTGPGGGGGWSALRLTVCRPGGFASRKRRGECRAVSSAGTAGMAAPTTSEEGVGVLGADAEGGRKQRRPRECVLGGAETREAESPLRGMAPKKGPFVASCPARRGRRCALGAGQHLPGPAWRFQASARRSQRRAGGGRERRPTTSTLSPFVPLADRAAWRRRRRLRGADDVSDRGTEPAGGRRETGTPCWTCVTANQGLDRRLCAAAGLGQRHPSCQATTHGLGRAP